MSKQLTFSRLFENVKEREHLGASFDQNQFIELLSKHKALLVQSKDGEEPLSVHEFGKIIYDLGLQHYPYVGGAAPRRIIPVDVPGGDNMIYTANEAPPDQLIPFHHELAQTSNPPEYIFFYCEQPSETGGETALIDSTLVYRFVHDNFPCFMEKLKLHGARYARTLPPQDDKTSPIGRSFYNTYQVKTIEEVEAKLKKIDGLDYTWLPDGCLRIVSEPVPAVRFIDQQSSGNFIHQYTFHNSVIAAFVGWEDSRNDRKKAVRFGNDEEMDENVLEAIAKFMEANKVNYTWKKGDFFALNNRLVMHSRNAYTGTRRVYAAMFGGPLSDQSNPNSSLQPRSTFIADPTTFGCWRLDDPEETVYNAIKSGYRRIDSACDYGNEKDVGRGIARAIKDGICSREDLFITSKLWNTYHAPEHVPLACNKSLNDLGLSYIDEYLIHFPISMEFIPFDKKYPPEWQNLEGRMVVVKNDINQTWKAMESLFRSQKVRSIGLSNFNCQHIRQILSIAEIPPSILQIECHPHLSQSKLIRFARSCNMNVSVFSPMGATSYISLDMATIDDVLFQNPVIERLAKHHKKTPAQIMLRWAIQRNTIPISKSSSSTRMIENRSLYDFYLSKEDVSLIDGLNKNRRYNDPGVFCEEAFGTFCPIYE